jgi:hypothetical protein
MFDVCHLGCVPTGVHVRGSTPALAFGFHRRHIQNSVHGHSHS